LPIGLALGWTSQRTLQVVLASAAACAIIIEALRATWPAFAKMFAQAVGGLLRTHERAALTGATWLALAMAAVLWFAPLNAAIAALWAAALGDAAAAVVGRSATRLRQRPVTGKTFIGSAAALAVTATGVLWLTPASVVVALSLGAVAAIAERPAKPLDDNLRIALAVALAATLLGLR
jgi:dolichol kinase